MRTTTIFAETHTSERANHVAYRLVIYTSRLRRAIIEAAALAEIAIFRVYGVLV